MRYRVILAQKKIAQGQKKTKNKTVADFTVLDQAIKFAKQLVNSQTDIDFRGIGIKGVSVSSSGEEILFKDI